MQGGHGEQIHGVFHVEWGTSSTLTYIKLSNGNGDRQKFGGPSFCGRFDGVSPVSTARNRQEMPSELFDKLPEMIPMFTHKLGDDEEWLSRATYE